MFDSAKLKIGRARKHIGELKDTFAEYQRRRPYTIAVRNLQATRQMGLGVQTEPLPKEIPVIIGDIVHNLRSALDHAACDLAKSKSIKFPFNEERSKFFDAEGAFECKRTLALDSARPGLGTYIIDTIKPYKAGNGLLWSVNKLNNIDKHEAIVPTVSPVSAEVNDLIHIENQISVQKITMRADSTGFLPIGNLPYGTVEIRGEVFVTLQLLFGRIAAVDRLPVIPALIDMADAVGESLIGIESFISK